MFSSPPSSKSMLGTFALVVEKMKSSLDTTRKKTLTCLVSENLCQSTLTGRWIGSMPALTSSENRAPRGPPDLSLTSACRPSVKLPPPVEILHQKVCIRGYFGTFCRRYPHPHPSPLVRNDTLLQSNKLSKITPVRKKVWVWKAYMKYEKRKKEKEIQLFFLKDVTITTLFSFVTIWVFEFCHNLSFKVLSQFVFLRFVTIWVFSQFEFLSLVTIWVLSFATIRFFEFCHYLSFQVLSQFEFSSFVTFWVVEFCHS